VRVEIKVKLGRDSRNQQTRRFKEPRPKSSSFSHKQMTQNFKLKSKEKLLTKFPLSHDTTGSFNILVVLQTPN
jgi:hypothetical protein